MCGGMAGVAAGVRAACTGACGARDGGGGGELGGGGGGGVRGSAGGRVVGVLPAVAVVSAVSVVSVEEVRTEAVSKRSSFKRCSSKSASGERSCMSGKLSRRRGSLVGGCCGDGFAVGVGVIGGGGVSAILGGLV